MKVMKKGKVYPSSSSTFSSYKDPDSVLKLLPITILALALPLPKQDLEVLAYLIARSVNVITTTKTRTSSSSSSSQRIISQDFICKHDKRNPLFECGCFDCYTSFWYRWDCSPNRELIHQVIEAFEEHLVICESAMKHRRSGGKRRNNKLLKGVIKEAENEVVGPERINEGGDMEERRVICEEERNGEVTGDLIMEVVDVQVDRSESKHKGLTRKVLPDVVGLLNSRLWSLWSPGN